MSEYSEYVVQTFRASGGGSAKTLRVHPLPGQGVDANMNVECSSKMRDSQPAGAMFAITAKVTNREGGPPFLYTSFRWAYKVVSAEEAKQIISRRRLG